MNHGPEQSTSVWMAHHTMPSFAPLQTDLEVDVCIIGAGLAGLTCAYLLSREGQSVAVLDAGAIAGGETGRTTAHLSNVLDDRFVEIERYFGLDHTRRITDSHTTAIATIEAIVHRERIACDFERLDGYLFSPPGQPFNFLKKEYDAALRAGLTDVSQVDRAPWPDFNTGPALRFGVQAMFNPLKYVTALTGLIQAAKGQMYTQTHVSAVEGGEPACAITDIGHRVQAKSIIVATNTPINDRVVMHTKLASYRSYVVAAHIPRGAIPRALYWDAPEIHHAPEPYHYVRLWTAPNGDDVVIVGGEDHKTGQSTDDSHHAFTRLEQWTRERFPFIHTFEYRWSGQIMEPVDGVAYIGRNPLDTPNIYLATGDSGMGMTHGTIAGIVLTDLILGRSNPWSAMYDPARKSFRAATRYVRENANVAKQYGDWMRPGEVASLDEIPLESGAIFRHHLHPVAVYRDGNNTLHAVSGTCTHLGCIVHWNAVEQSWDCPCHGSRFNPYGKVLHGPAVTDLPIADIADAKKRQVS